MTRIDKNKAAQIAGVHPKTLERIVSNDDRFRLVTGYAKAVNKRISFDETAFRTHAPEWFTGTAENIETNTDTSDIEENVIDAETVKTENKALAKRENTDTPDKTKIIDHEQSVSDFFQVMANSNLLPHKLFYTLDEAVQLTSLTKAYLHQFSENIGGRRVIRRAKLETI